MTQKDVQEVLKNVSALVDSLDLNNQQDQLSTATKFSQVYSMILYCLQLTESDEPESLLQSYHTKVFFSSTQTDFHKGL